MLKALLAAILEESLKRSIVERRFGYGYEERLGKAMVCNGCKTAWIATMATFLALTCSGLVFGQAHQHNREALDRTRAEGARSESQKPDNPRYREDQGKRIQPFPRQYDERPQSYRGGHAYSYGGAPAFDEGFQAELERAYQRGVEDGRRLERYNMQTEESNLSTHRGAMARGKSAFENGDYALAARQFLLATTLNQSDPAARLAAAHALVALGSYEPAVRLLRRAFELQPNLAYLPLQIRGAYGNPDHFALHLTALHEAALKDENNPEIWLLLGYFGYYSNNMAVAADALERATKLLPNDGLIRQLFELSSMSVQRTSQDSDGRK